MISGADLSVEAVGEVPVATVKGEVDMGNARDVKDALLASVANHAPGLVVDLSPTTYVDSAGVHVVFDLARRLQARQQELRVVVPEEAPIRRVLVLTNVDAVAPMHTALDEAVAGVAARGAASQRGDAG